jgi:hypothetical protein
MATQITQQTTLAGITPALIDELVRNDSDETIDFDFKHGPDSQDPKSAYNVRKAFASFANTRGGFLFFGVLDKASTNKQGLDRLVGVNNTSEFGRQITQRYLGGELCIPMVHFEGPAILTVRDKAIPVIRIPRSSNRPHAIKEKADRVLEFWARGAGTARPMDYSYLLSEVDRSREERGWLIALFIDSDSLIAKAEKTEQMAFADPVYVLPPKYNSIISGSLGDLLRVLGSDVAVTQKLLPLKDLLHEADAAWDHTDSVARQRLPFERPSSHPTMTHVERVRQLKMDLGTKARRITTIAIELRDHLVASYPTVKEWAETYNPS